jgi:molybdopterin-guanine dinucleotide biosynthesis protein
MRGVSVPVLLITGPVGAGKTSVLAEVTELLEAAAVPFAVVDLDSLPCCYPAPPEDDRFRSGLTFTNLAHLASRPR